MQGHGETPGRIYSRGSCRYKVYQNESLKETSFQLEGADKLISLISYSWHSLDSLACLPCDARPCSKNLTSTQLEHETVEGIRIDLTDRGPYLETKMQYCTVCYEIAMILVEERWIRARRSS